MTYFLQIILLAASFGVLQTNACDPSFDSLLEGDEEICAVQFQYHNYTQRMLVHLSETVYCAEGYEGAAEGCSEKSVQCTRKNVVTNCKVTFHYPDRPSETVNMYARKSTPCRVEYEGVAHGCSQEEIFCSPRLELCEVKFLYPQWYKYMWIYSDQTMSCDNGFSGSAQGCSQKEILCVEMQSRNECQVKFNYPNHSDTVTVAADGWFLCRDGYAGMARGCLQENVTCTPVIEECQVKFNYPDHSDTVTVAADGWFLCRNGYAGMAKGCLQEEVTCTRL